MGIVTVGHFKGTIWHELKDKNIQNMNKKDNPNAKIQ